MAIHVAIHCGAAQICQSPGGGKMIVVRLRWVMADKKHLGKIEGDRLSRWLAVAGDRVDLAPGWVVKDFLSDDDGLQGQQE